MFNKRFHERILATTTVMLAVILSITSLVGCDDQRLLGKEIYFEGDKCSYTFDADGIYFTCKPLSKLEYEDGEPVYYGSIEDIEDVIDGDTINRVTLLFHRYGDGPMPIDLDAWPGIQKREDGIYIKTNIRIFGVDAPEIRRTGSGTAEEKERMVNRGFAVEAYLKSLVEQSVIDGVRFAMEIRNPTFGTYPRRTVADLYLYIDNERVKVADKLFETRHAIPYSNDADFDWGAEELDFAGWYEMLGMDDPYVEVDPDTEVDAEPDTNNGADDNANDVEGDV